MEGLQGLVEWNGGRLPEILHADADKFWRSGEDQVFAGIIPLSPRVIGDIEVPQIGSLRDICGNPTGKLVPGKVYICDIRKLAEFKRYLTGEGIVFDS
ncbi:hypothetical protein OIU76_009326 [Salix suchowensis]|nr:hypothetical protein OIU76_009326 [Salix suchowensis]